MTGAVGQALEQALAYHRAPGRLSVAHGRPLPEGVITLLRLAGADQAMAAQCAEASGESQPEVVAAAVFFIQQVMFANGSDSYRVLGVNPNAPDARIKEHYRWLVRWLHPDRNTDDWDSVYADRVNAAWQTLRLPERRRQYDESVVSGLSGVEGFQRVRSVPAHVVLPETALLSSSTVQRLPILVLGGLGGFAVVILSLMWLGADQGAQSGRRAPLEVAVEPPAALAPALADAAAETSDNRLSQASPTRVAAETPMPIPAPPAALPDPEAIGPAIAAAMPLDEGAERTSPAVNQVDDVPVAPRIEPALEGAAPPIVRVAVSKPSPSATPLPAALPAPRKMEPAPPVPAVAAPAVRGAGAPEPVLQEAQAHQLLREFGLAYQSGDINALMRLFTADARNNRGGRDAIVYDYQSLFSGTESRQLDLTPTGWILREEGGTLLATYRARVRSSGRLRADVSKGTIRFDVRMVDGQARISQVRLDDGV